MSLLVGVLIPTFPVFTYFNTRSEIYREIKRLRLDRVIVEKPIIPVITLIGSAALTLEGSNIDIYSDPGANCVDREGRDISSQIVVGGDTVNLAVPGSYTITYNCDDALGNQAVEVIREVIVQDTTKPVITLNGSNIRTLEASLDSYVDEGVVCLDDLNGNITDRVETRGDVVNLAVPGSYVIVYECQDLSGNPASEISRLVIVQDTTPPVINLIGPSVVTVELGTGYNDTGSAAEDSFRGQYWF